MSGHDEHDLLTTTLRDRAGDMDGHTLGLDDVKGRARGIRRRRRAMTGAVAAAVLAVAVPVGLNVTDVDRGQQPLPTNPSPSVVESPEPSPSGPVTIDAAGAPRGQDPALVYVTGTTLHRPGGPDVELPQAYSWVAPYADGWMGFFGPDGTTTIVDGDGKAVQGPWPGISGAISSDGQSLATVMYAGGGNVDAQLWPREGADPDEGYGSHVVALDGELQYAGFVGPETVAYNLTVSNNQGATQKPYVASWYSNDGPRRLTSLMDVRGSNDVTGVVSGLTTADYSKNEYCFAVVEAASDTVVWDTCDYRLGRFSPDGKYVLGVDPETDGLGGRSVTMLDAENGDVVAEFTVGERSFMQDTIWESNSTALVPVMQDGSWFLVRIRPDGTVEKALEPSREGYDDSSPWRFQLTP